MERFFLWINALVVIFLNKIFHMEKERAEISAEKMFQLLKFGIVGLSNTFVSYVVYLILYSVGVNYIISNVMSFMVSVVNAFYWNNKYVFKQNETENRNLARAFFKTVVAYAGTGLVLNNILLVVWVEVIGVPEIIAPVISLLITVPLNFILNKFWAFRK